MRRLMDFLVIPAVLFLGAANTCWADFVTYTFSGTITSTNTFGTSTLPFSTGASFTGSFSYNDAAPGFTPMIPFGPNPDFEYEPAEVTINLLVDGTYNYSRSYAAPEYSQSTYSFVDVTTSRTPESMNIGVQSESGGSAYGTSNSSNNIDIVLTGNQGLLSSTTLANLVIDPTKLTFADILFNDTTTPPFFTWPISGVNFEGTITQLNDPPAPGAAVPEPSSLVTLACGIAITLGGVLRMKPQAQHPAGR